MTFFSISIIFIAFLLTLLLTASVKRILLRRAMLDIPNERSSHKTPVPRGGGWALLIVLLPALLGAAVFIDHDARHAGLIAAVLLLAIISWLDDRNGVNAAMRLSLHIAATCLGSFSFADQETLFNGMLPFWLDRALMIVGWAWFINLYNFMDGIDGITGAETVCIATGICLVMQASGIDDAFLEFLTLALTGVSLGFLAYNWHPAKVFLGDVGSVPLGFLVGYSLLFIAIKGHLAAALILPLYYLADSGITITKRAMRGEKIWQAHREHFYQKASFGGGGHDKTVILIIIANIGLIGAALMSVSQVWAGAAVGMGIVAILLQKMNRNSLKINNP